jgi:SAM-dependent methyltransferase
MDFSLDGPQSMFENGPRIDQFSPGWLDSAIGKPAIERVLEVGCRDGDRMGALRRDTNGFVVGIDNDRDYEDRLDALMRMGQRDARHAPSTFAVAFADAAKLPFADSSFDLIHASMVLRFGDLFETAFPEFSRVIRQNGVLVVADWFTGRYSTVADTLIDDERDPNDPRSINQVVSNARNSGFRIRDHHANRRRRWLTFLQRFEAMDKTNANQTATSPTGETLTWEEIAPEVRAHAAALDKAGVIPYDFIDVLVFEKS